MFSTAQPADSRPNRLWSAVTGARGPAEALALFLGGLVLLLAFVPGAAWVRLVVLHPFEFIERAVNREPNALFIGIPVFAGIAAGLLFIRSRRFAEQRLGRILLTALTVVGVPAILIGGMGWIATNALDFLILILAQSTLLFSLVWSARTLPPLVASAVSRPLNALVGTGMAFAGAAIAVAAASAAAALRGGDLGRLDSTHVFYVWIVPALAGFGWGAPRPQGRSQLFACAAGLVIVLMVIYAIPVHFAEPPHVECDFPYEKPRHVAYGFQFEPWRWEVDRSYAWLVAPGAFAELTLRYIAQPLIRFTCTDSGDLPSAASLECQGDVKQEDIDPPIVFYCPSGALQP